MGGGHDGGPIGHAPLGRADRGASVVEAVRRGVIIRSEAIGTRNFRLRTEILNWGGVSDTVPCQAAVRGCTKGTVRRSSAGGLQPWVPCSSGSQAALGDLG